MTVWILHGMNYDSESLCVPSFTPLLIIYDQRMSTIGVENRIALQWQLAEEKGKKDFSNSPRERDAVTAEAELKETPSSDSIAHIQSCSS